MTNNELELKLARLAGNLVRDLDEIDATTFERSAARQQKVQLAREAFGEAYVYLDQLRPPRPKPRPIRFSRPQIGGSRAPDSLADRAGG